MYGCCLSLLLEAGDSSLYGEASMSEDWYLLCPLLLRDGVLCGVVGLISH